MDRMTPMTLPEVNVFATKNLLAAAERVGGAFSRAAFMRSSWAAWTASGAPGM
jgi:hypothetical protein